jgi:predicted nucleotidyltransferase
MKDKYSIIKNIINIIEAKEYVIFAYIFGSFTSSYSGKMSREKVQETPSNTTFKDIDIAIYISKSMFEEASSLEFELEHELENILSFDFDVRIINYAPIPFQYNVIKDGIVIIDRDELLRVDFEGLVLKKYFDFVYIRDEYLRESSNAKI